MLKIEVPDKEFYDNKTETFFTIKGDFLLLEHSLKAISNWESKWKKPFLVDTPKTVEESIDYIRCMTLNDVDPQIYTILPNSVMPKVQKYIETEQTATTIIDHSPRRARREVITSELIYYWMFSQQVPLECETWHLSRLITLLQICSIKNAPGKKMKNKEVANQYRSLNAARKKSLGTSG